jgi:glutaredoxin
MDIQIYTTNGCIWCTRTKELFVRANVEYTETVWDTINPTEQSKLKEKYPNMEAFPVVIIDNQFVGGLMEVAKLFLKEGLVSSRQG